MCVACVDELSYISGMVTTVVKGVHLYESWSSDILGCIRYTLYYVHSLCAIYTIYNID